MPDLRAHGAAGIMDGVDHLLPTGKRFLAAEKWNIGQVARGRAVDHGAFGKNEAHFAFGAAAIIVRILVIGDAFGSEVARHGSHDKAVLEG